MARVFRSKGLREKEKNFQKTLGPIKERKNAMITIA